MEWVSVTTGYYIRGLKRKVRKVEELGKIRYKKD
jgi:hypothetical protein